MFEMLRTMYLAGTLDDAGLDKAVDPKGWITQSEADAIKAEAA